jgi:hypothetical protein
MLKDLKIGGLTPRKKECKIFIWKRAKKYVNSKIKEIRNEINKTNKRNYEWKRKK